MTFFIFINEVSYELHRKFQIDVLKEENEINLLLKAGGNWLSIEMTLDFVPTLVSAW